MKIEKGSRDQAECGLWHTTAALYLYQEDQDYTKRDKWCFLLGEDSGGLTHTHTRPIAITGRDNNQTNGVGLVTNCCFSVCVRLPRWHQQRSVICSEIIDATPQERTHIRSHHACLYQPRLF